ncbi:unnamed protein product [Symbiodinium necroappetens]|uniref:Pentatricopeptide repeat-containing protein, chloroplastic n=1 Tax=Symbiodinium necroappetens TaxID=1628268 RepID=A0A813C785_9DINO|nr:unnamed protein product [Symbiodinium sp. CCMP2456]CAE7938894.1 unnamed protein product [Symbiodinium necroappetens]
MISLQPRKSINPNLLRFLLAWICSPLLFAHTGQEPLNSFRERKGFALRAPASSWVKQTEVLTEEERSLAVMLARTKKKGWARASKAIQEYTGCAGVVFNAAMKAAHACGEYREGVSIYDRMCKMQSARCTISYSMAMKLYGRLKLMRKVQEAFDEAEAAGVINEISISARIEAAAAEGDWNTAAGMLDYAQQCNLSLDNTHFNSVLAACANSRQNRSIIYKAANQVVDFMTDYNLQPDIITFTNLVRAHHPSEDVGSIRNLWQQLLQAEVVKGSGSKASKLLDISDEVFTENLLTTAVQLPKNRFYKSELMVAEALDTTSSERLRLAQVIVAELQAKAAPMTLLGKRIAGAVRKALRQRG